MNKKKITKIISVLLVLILLISFPLETQANAVAVESWLIYSIITYATAVGFSFAVVGGVDAMYNTVKEKADEYNNIIDFYDIMRQNIKFVPDPNRPPNSDLLSLFFTAAGVDAMSNFLTWLTTEGGLSAGTYEMSNEYGIFSATIEGRDTLFQTSLITEPPQRVYHAYDLSVAGTVIPIDTSEYNGGAYPWYNMINQDTFTYKSAAGFNCYYQWHSSGTQLFYYYGDTTATHSYSIDVLQLFNDAGYTGTVESVVGITCVDSVRSADGAHILWWGLVTNDNKLITWFNSIEPYDYGSITTNSQKFPYDFVPNVSGATIQVPSDIIKPLPTVQEGLLMSNVELGSTDAIEWANKVEELFIETGTIPNPQPEIIQDPDFAPEPTPVPTPVPSPEIEDIEDLGLPTLGDAIFSKFPFSLPKDVGRIFTLLHADPVTPYWQVDLTGNALGISSNFEVDLAEYEVLGQITRWFSVVSYCLFLILITRGMIKW